MNLKTLREFIDDHPEGVVVRMMDGAEHQIPHRDDVWFTPAYEKSKQCVGRFGASFWLRDLEKDETRLVNASPVKDVAALMANGNGQDHMSSRCLQMNSDSHHNSSREPDVSN